MAGRHFSSVRARVRALGQAVGWLVARVAAASAPPMAVKMPEELMAGPADTRVEDLLRRLRTDRGCIGHEPRRHLACGAARELELRGAHEPEVLAALEETLTVADRPACVRGAAVAAMCSLAPVHGRRTLARMRALAQRRLEFEGRGRKLVIAMDQALRALPA